MLLYMYVDQSQLEEGEFEKLRNALQSPLYTWIEAYKHPVIYVGPNLQEADADQEDIASATAQVFSEHELGIQIEVKKKQYLKEPLNFLYDLAKNEKCEFVIGFFEEDGAREDVCYFGYEEGRPDLYEIANYVGL